MSFHGKFGEVAPLDHLRSGAHIGARAAGVGGSGQGLERWRAPKVGFFLRRFCCFGAFPSLMRPVNKGVGVGS